MEIEIIGKSSARGMCLNMTKSDASHLSCRGPVQVLFDN